MGQSTPTESQDLQPDTALRRGLRALTIGRVVVVTVLLVATALLEWRSSQMHIGLRSEVALVRLVAVMIVLSLGYFVLLNAVRDPRSLIRLAYGQLAGDAVFAFALVLITGGTSSVFTFFFSMIIVVAAILLNRSGALLMATVAALLLLFIGLLELGIIEAPTVIAEFQAAGVDPWGTDAPPPQAVALSLAVNVVGFFAIAMLGSLLVRQLRLSDEQIQQSQLSLDDLRVLHRNIVSSIQSGLITVDENLMITFVTPEVERITGLSGREMLGRPISQIFGDLKPILANPDKVMGQNEELTLQVLRGALTYLRWSISPLKDARGELVGRVLIFDDVTQDRAQRERMKHEEQFASLGRLAAAIAHEIRNPLTSISGSIQMLSNNVELSEDDSRLMNIVSREIENLNQWLSDFLTYARPRMGERIPLNLHALIQEALVVLKGDEKFANIETVHEGVTTAMVDGDPTYLKQVIWNILNNAVQVMPQGGRLTVRIEPHEDDRGFFHRVRFTDTGPGIPKHVLERLFEPFFTTKPSGTGLGLATAFRIVSEHGGNLSAESPPGEGASFVLELPQTVN